MTRFMYCLFILLIVSCSNRAGDDTAVPRRTAFPRVPALSDSMIVQKVGNVCFELNADALARRPSDIWLDAVYTSLGATMHLSVNHLESVKALEDAYNNRLQRISLNLGDAPAEVSHVVNSHDFDCEMVVALEGVATPVQFIAAGPGGTFVSGSFVISGKFEPADSIRPVVDALQSQVLLLLNTLHIKQ